MKKLALFLCAIAFIVARHDCMAQKDTRSSSMLLVKGDFWGLSVAIPSGWSYCWLSPELEWQPHGFKSLSISLDLEYFQGAPAIEGNYDRRGFGNKEYLVGEIQDHNYAVRLGLRKYFGSRRDTIQGFFVEGQVGLGHSKLDTIFYVSDQPLQRQSNQVGIELRVRTGYQMALTNRLWFSVSVAGDLRRIAGGQAWYRCFLPELNIAYRF